MDLLPPLFEINFRVSQNLYISDLWGMQRGWKKRRKRKEGRKETERSRSEKCRSAGARRVSLVRRPVKNSDNTSSCVGPHLNVCIHTLWCIALTRGVVKIIQTDPDSFFSFLSGLGHFLAERCARCTHLHFFLPCPLHCPLSIGWFRHPRLLDHLSFFPPVLFLLSLSLYTSLFAALSPLRSLLAIVPSRGVEFEIATLFRSFSRPIISRLCDGISIRGTLWYLRGEIREKVK